MRATFTQALRAQAQAAKDLRAAQKRGDVQAERAAQEAWYAAVAAKEAAQRQDR